MPPWDPLLALALLLLLAVLSGLLLQLVLVLALLQLPLLPSHALQVALPHQLLAGMLQASGPCSAGHAEAACVVAAAAAAAHHQPTFAQVRGLGCMPLLGVHVRSLLLLLHVLCCLQPYSAWLQGCRG
jgi:hypothetical protein